MRKKLFALLSAAALISNTALCVYAEPDISAAEDNSIDYHPASQEQKDRRSSKQSIDQIVLGAENDTDSVIYSDNVTSLYGGIQELTREEKMALVNKFRQATENFEEEIDIAEFEIGYDEETDTVDIAGGISFGEFYEMLIYSSPRSYYLISDNGTYDYFYPYAEDGKILYIYPIYSKFKSGRQRIYDEDLWIDINAINNIEAEVVENLHYFDAEIEKIKKIVNDDDTDFEKILKYHDYIVMNYSYDWADYSKPFYERNSNTALSLLTTHKGLCESISVLYNYLLMDCGLDTAFVTSFNATTGSAYHTWNMVKVEAPNSTGEEWYHVDVTWDENITEHASGDVDENNDKIYVKNEGKTYLDNFLISDYKAYTNHANEIENVNYKRDCGADKTQLDNAEWRTSDSQVVEYNGNLYYISYDQSKSTLYEIRSDGKNIPLYKFDGNWSGVDNTSESGLVLKGDTLYFNTKDQVRAYNLISKKIVSTDIELDDSKEIFALYSETPDEINYCTAKINGAYISPIKKDGTLTISEVRPGTPTLNGSTLTIPVQSSDLAASFSIFVKGDNGIEMKSIDANSDILMELTKAPLNAKVFVWDSTMTPYMEPVNLQ